MFEVTLTPGHRGEWLGLARYGQGLPQPGRYSLGILDKSKSGEFYATYIRHGRLPSDTNYAYVSVAGELIVAHSSPQLVEGRLHFTGAEYSAVSPAGRSGSGSPDKIEPNAPTIDVSASFSAIPASASVEVACMGTSGPSVLVEVRDAHGRPAALGATLEIREGSFRASSEPQYSWDGLHVSAGGNRPGTYEGRVTKPWYRPVEIHGIRAPGDSLCHSAGPTDIRKVTLELLPGAPPVRQILVFPPSSSLGIPGWPETMAAYVDADPEVSTAVTWSSSDTTVVKVLPTGVIIPQCRRGRGIAKVFARSVVNPRVKGSGTVEVDPVRDSRGLGGPSEAIEKVDACQRRLGRFPKD